MILSREKIRKKSEKSTCNILEGFAIIGVSKGEGMVHLLSERKEKTMARIKITSVFLKNKGYVKTADEVFAEVNDPDILTNEEISSIDSRLMKMYNETNLNFWYDVCD